MRSVTTMNWLAGSSVLLFLFLALCSPAGAQAASLEDVRSLLAQGQPEAALEAVDAYLEEAVDDRQGRFVKGVVLSELGRRDEAITVFEKLVEDYPDLPEPHNNLAVLYASRGDLSQARDSLLQAITIHPSYAIAHENLGDIYARMAEIAYQRAVELDQSNDTARQKLAQLSEVTDLAGAVPAKSAQRTDADSVAPRVAPVRSSSAGGPPPPAEVLRGAVLAWAQHWSDQNVDAYLASYSESFRPPGGRSRRDWQAQRRRLLAKPASIQISISDFEVVRSNAESARVTFKQGYRSDTYADQVKKRMDLVRSGDEWKISSERSLGKI